MLGRRCTSLSPPLAARVNSHFSRSLFFNSKQQPADLVENLKQGETFALTMGEAQQLNKTIDNKGNLLLPVKSFAPLVRDVGRVWDIAESSRMAILKLYSAQRAAQISSIAGNWTAEEKYRKNFLEAGEELFGKGNVVAAFDSLILFHMRNGDFDKALPLAQKTAAEQQSNKDLLNRFLLHEVACKVLSKEKNSNNNTSLIENLEKIIAQSKEGGDVAAAARFLHGYVLLSQSSESDEKGFESFQSLWKDGEVRKDIRLMALLKCIDFRMLCHGMVQKVNDELTDATKFAEEQIGSSSVEFALSLAKLSHFFEQRGDAVVGEGIIRTALKVASNLPPTAHHLYVQSILSQQYADLLSKIVYNGQNRAEEGKMESNRFLDVLRANQIAIEAVKTQKKNNLGEFYWYWKQLTRLI